MNTCKTCNKSVTVRHKVLCNDCKQCFHLTCVDLTKEELDYLTSEKQIWRCSNCSQSRRKSMQECSDAGEGGASLEQVVSMLKEAKEDRRRMEKEMNTSFEYLHGVVKDQKNILSEQSQQIKSFTLIIDNLKQDNLELRNKIKALEVKVDENDQYSWSNTIEIHGMPESAKEDVYEVVTNVAVALGVKITRNAIDVCHRLGKRANYTEPPGIIARFVRREDKHLILEKRRAKRNFNTKDLGITQAATPVYVNESLCPGKRSLFAAARQAKTEKSYNFLWISNGRILMRKEPSASVKVINSMDDLVGL